MRDSKARLFKVFIITLIAAILFNRCKKEEDVPSCITEKIHWEKDQGLKSVVHMIIREIEFISLMTKDVLIFMTKAVIMRSTTVYKLCTIAELVSVVFASVIFTPIERMKTAFGKGTK